MRVSVGAPKDSSGGMKKAKSTWEALQKKDSKHWCGINFVATHIYPEPGKGAKRWNAMLGEVQDTLKEMGSPTKKIWITETLYGLLGDPIATDEKAAQLVKDTYEYSPWKFVIHGMPGAGCDLNAGFLIDHGTATWNAIKEHG